MLPASDPAGRIGFRPMTRDDLPMVAGWLAVPEIARWWGDAGDLDDPCTTQEIAKRDDAPYAYREHDDCHAWDDAPEFAYGPLRARVIQQRDLIQGHIAAMLRRLGDGVLAEGASALVIDPDPSNERAVRAYRRAGFAGDRITPGWDGDPVLILERWPADRAED